jgi:DNA-binding NtrC family response regulator
MSQGGTSDEVSLGVLKAVAENMPLAEVRRTFVANTEKQYLECLFISSKGNITVVARKAGVSIRELRKLIRKHKINLPDSQTGFQK